MKNSALLEYTKKWDECHRNLLKYIEDIYELQKNISCENNKNIKKLLIGQKKEVLIKAQDDTGWAILEGERNDEKGRLGNTFPSYRYFPEPYYCKNFEDPINLIFVNINPYTGGPQQDIASPERDQTLYKKADYSEIISQYLTKNNPTAENFFKKRLDWAKSLFETNEELNILCSDIVPWHTEKANGIDKYITNKKNRETIKSLVLVPLMNISDTLSSVNNKSMQNKIIVRGVPFRNIINGLYAKDKPNLKQKYIKNYIVLKKKGTIEEFISMLTVISMNNKNKKEFKWYLFTGMPSNDLPPLEKNYIVYPVNAKVNKPESLISFLLK